MAGAKLETADRWTHLDAYLPRHLRSLLEERFWRPIEAASTLEVLRDDPSFFADPGRHPAIFADHGVVHVRDVAGGLIELLDIVDGLLIAARPPERRRFVAAYGVAAAYLHDVGMIDTTRVGRRIHPQFAAHAAYSPGAAPLAEHVLATGPVGDRLAAVGRHAPFTAPLELVACELLSLSAAHSKTTIPIEVLNDHAALRRAMQDIVFTSLDEHRAAVGEPTRPARGAADGVAARYPDPGHAFAWLEAAAGPQAELADDVIDALRVLRAADVLRQRGTALRTSGGYEICFDARTAHAVCTLRTADGDAAYVITYADVRGAGEANIRVAHVSAQGHLRIAFHRGGFPDEEVAGRAAASVAHAILDIEADVIPAFSGTPARGLPAPRRRSEDMRIQLEQPGDDAGFADAVGRALAALDPSLEPRLEIVANVEDATPEERARFFLAEPVDANEPLAAEIAGQLASHGSETAAIDWTRAFREVGRTTIRGGEVLVAAGSPPSFVYVPMGPGLVVRPAGGYAPSPLHAWVPVGTTGVIRRSERNSEILAERDVEVVIIPGERYARDWLRPLRPAELRARLAAVAVHE